MSTGYAVFRDRSKAAPAGCTIRGVAPVKKTLPSWVATRKARSYIKMFSRFSLHLQ